MLSLPRSCVKYHDRGSNFAQRFQKHGIDTWTQPRTSSAAWSGLSFSHKTARGRSQAAARGARHCCQHRLGSALQLICWLRSSLDRCTERVCKTWVSDLSNLVATVAHFFRLAALVAAVGVDAAKGWRIRVFKSQGCTGPAEPRPDALPAGGYHSDARTPEGRGA